MEWVGKKALNLNKDRNKKTESLNKMIGKKIFQPRKK